MSAVSTPSHEIKAGATARTDAHGCDPEHLDHAEDASHNVVGDGALNESQPGDVDERVPDSHDR